MQKLTNPTNPTTGKEYTGANVERLIDAGYESMQFATFRQWQGFGRCVKKGEKSTKIQYVKSWEERSADSDKPNDITKRGFARGYSVFAFEQTRPLDESVTVEPMSKEEASAVFKRSNVNPDKLRGFSETMKRKVEACFAVRMTNTPKRLAQAMSKRLDGERLERACIMLDAIATHLEKGGTLDVMAIYSASQIKAACLESAIKETKPCANGYHSYMVEFSDGKWIDNNPQHIECRSFLAPSSPENEREKKRIQEEESLRHAQIEGFFPTPKPVIDVMLEQSGSLDGLSVLEPCAGKGDIIKAVKDSGAADVEGFEINPKLAAYCNEFVGMVACEDFFDYNPTKKGQVDRILMNPPFERNQAPRFVVHALSWLKNAGKLVSVMPANWAEKKSADAVFDLIDDNGMDYTEIEIETGSFNGADSFRKTGVNVSLLVITK